MEWIITVVLFVAVSSLAVVYGMNAGATMASIGLSVRAISPWIAVVILGVAVALAPLVVGTAVATTLSEELIAFDGVRGQLMLAAAVVATLAVVSAANRWRVPSSLTLALLASLGGVGVGAGAVVQWPKLAAVVAAILAAPLVGATIAVVAVKSVRFLTLMTRRATPALHLLGFAALATGFGANDGQKILALLMVSSGTGTTLWAGDWRLALAGGLFALGAAVGVQKMYRTISRGVLTATSTDVVTAQVATASVMFGSSALGAPVGMAQTLSGALLGSGLGRRAGGIRWDAVARIAGVWGLMLPLSLAVSVPLGLIVGAVVPR